MSTKSGIGIVNADGTVTSIYCHNDGYPEHQFITLTLYYNDEFKARELIGLGDLSFVGKYLYNENHNYEHPAPNTTLAYCRDRYEEYRVDKWPSLDEYLKSAWQSYCADYLYWFKDGKWNYA